METILTIDFDIIMWQNIEAYNQLVEGDRDDMAWIEDKIALIKDIQPDYNLYYELTDLLLSASVRNIPIYFVESHDECFNYLSQSCKLINIDHHHDLGYGENISQQPLSCGNWAFQALKNNIINSYLWLHRDTSVVNYKNFSIYNRYKINDIDLKDINIVDLNNYNKIVISFSESWIPMHIRPLFKLWKSLFKGE